MLWLPGPPATSKVTYFYLAICSRLEIRPFCSQNGKKIIVYVSDYCVHLVDLSTFPGSPLAETAAVEMWRFGRNVLAFQFHPGEHLRVPCAHPFVVLDEAWRTKAIDVLCNLLFFSSCNSAAW